MATGLGHLLLAHERTHRDSYWLLGYLDHGDWGHSDHLCSVKFFRISWRLGVNFSDLRRTGRMLIVRFLYPPSLQPQEGREQFRRVWKLWFIRETLQK